MRGGVVGGLAAPAGHTGLIFQSIQLIGRRRPAGGRGCGAGPRLGHWAQHATCHGSAMAAEAAV